MFSVLNKRKNDQYNVTVDSTMLHFTILYVAKWLT